MTTQRLVRVTWGERGRDKRVHATHTQEGKAQELVWSAQSNITKVHEMGEEQHLNNLLRVAQGDSGLGPSCLPKLRPFIFFSLHLHVPSES